MPLCRLSLLRINADVMAPPIRVDASEPTRPVNGLEVVFVRCDGGCRHVVPLCHCAGLVAQISGVSKNMAAGGGAAYLVVESGVSVRTVDVPGSAVRLPPPIHTVAATRRRNHGSLDECVNVPTRLVELAEAEIHAMGGSGEIRASRIKGARG